MSLYLQSKHKNMIIQNIETAILSRIITFLLQKIKKEYLFRIFNNDMIRKIAKW